MLEINHAYYRYQPTDYVIKDISFSLKKHEILTILGRNGVGKTTLLKCISGLLPLEQGEIRVNNQILKKGFNASDYAIGYVPQARSLNFPYTVEELVLMGRAKHINVFSTPKKEDYDIVNETLDELKISSIKHHACTQLSGGQLQLVYIARALVAKPQILILDEPETHLDFNNQHMLMNLIRKITDEKELCCIINTHYPDYALKISNVSLLMKKGEHSFGNTQELLTSKNMKTYFDMKTKLIELDTDEGTKKSLVVL